MVSSMPRWLSAIRQAHRPRPSGRVQAVGAGVGTGMGCRVAGEASCGLARYYMRALKSSHTHVKHCKRRLVEYCWGLAYLCCAAQSLHPFMAGLYGRIVASCISSVTGGPCCSTTEDSFMLLGYITSCTLAHKCACLQLGATRVGHERSGLGGSSASCFLLKVR